MSQETNQPSSTSNLDELVEQIQGKLWNIEKILHEPCNLNEEGISKDEFFKRATKACARKQLLDLLPKVQAYIQEHEDPERAWWLFFEAAFDGLKVTTQLDNGEYALEPPKRHWRNKGALAREAYKEDLLYLFTRYIASPPSMEFFESMFKGWMRNLPRSGYYA